MICTMDLDDEYSSGSEDAESVQVKSGNKTRPTSSTLTRFSPDLPKIRSRSSKQLCVEDLKKPHKDLWLVQIPLGVDPALLEGKSILPGGSLVCHHSETDIKTETPDEVPLEITASELPKEALSAVVLPSRENKNDLARVVGISRQMSVCVASLGKHCLLPEKTGPKRRELPEGLVQRHVPFGADTPETLQKGKHGQKLKRKSFDVHSKGSPKKKKNRKSAP